MLKKIVKLSLAASLLLTSAQAATAVIVKDKTFNTAGSMLAYTEFELSGEPLAESLGLDLDTLDPAAQNVPTVFDYTAGIEAYEYSEEAMYAINYQSKMGPHLVNGLLNNMRGGNMQAFAKRFISFAKATSFPVEEIPLNMHPTALPYMAGYPEFASAVDMTPVNGDEVEITLKNGKTKTVQTVSPAYLRDYKTLAWVESGMNKTLNPAAIGGTLLKDVMWAQDFLGGMHVIENDEEVEAENAKMDQDGKHALGVSSADGFNGMVLAEIAHEKVLNLQERLGFDGKSLGAKITPAYDARKKPIWFAHKVAVTEGSQNGVKSIQALKVVDASSRLRDTWMLLWPVSEYYAFTDQRSSNKNQNPAFLAVYDGKPFAAAPTKNKDANENNNIVAKDAFSAASNVANVLFKNLEALHFNQKAGTLVDVFDGKQGSVVTTYDAAYSIEALRIFQRVRDALPVGYGSADDAKPLNTLDGKKAFKLLVTQADFILEKLIAPNGLAVDSFDLKTAQTKGQSVGTQFAVLRGLSAAYLATHNDKYRNAARALYVAIEKHMFDSATNTYADKKGKSTVYTPFTAAAVSGGLRDAIGHLKNAEGEKEKVLTLQHLTDRYAQWFQIVINGENTKEGMQLSEWLNDSGEVVVKGSDSVNNDEDNTLQIHAAGGKYGTAQTMAAKVEVFAK